MYATTNGVPLEATLAWSLRASSRVVVRGFSQRTPMPAAAAASAGPKWASLGVTMVR